MGKKGNPISRELFLGEWIEFFDAKVGDLARTASCTSSYVSNMAAKRKGGVNALYLLAISEALGITVNDLFSRPPTRAQVAQIGAYSRAAQGTILDHIRRKKSG